MTFEEWFETNGGEDGDWPYPEQILERYMENNLGPDDVKWLMREAWEGRYSTLTYNDL